jgi:hypothetical protein
MFERYTEPARRVIFFSRYEASQVGSPSIEPEHLLLGIIREDPIVLSRISGPGYQPAESIRAAILSAQTKGTYHTSVDLPLSRASKTVLRFAAEEAIALSHKHIELIQILLGLLQEQTTLAYNVLTDQGFRIEVLRANYFDPEYHIREAAVRRSSLLDLSRLQLRALPQSVLKLSDLASLFLQQNQIEVLPEEISTLERLEYLDLRSNFLTALPRSLQLLKNLKVLLLHGNDELGIPSEVLYQQPPELDSLQTRKALTPRY